MRAAVGTAFVLLVAVAFYALLACAVWCGLAWAWSVLS